MWCGVVQGPYGGRWSDAEKREQALPHREQLHVEPPSSLPCLREERGRERGREREREREREGDSGRETRRGRGKQREREGKLRGREGETDRERGRKR